jgi:hypothetical protein
MGSGIIANEANIQYAVGIANGETPIAGSTADASGANGIMTRLVALAAKNGAIRTEESTGFFGLGDAKVSFDVSKMNTEDFWSPQPGTDDFYAKLLLRKMAGKGGEDRFDGTRTFQQLDEKDLQNGMLKVLNLAEKGDIDTKAAFESVANAVTMDNAPTEKSQQGHTLQKLLSKNLLATRLECIDAQIAGESCHGGVPDARSKSDASIVP